MMIAIPGAERNPYVLRPELCYVHAPGDAAQSCRCPGCGGLGTPWAGWFSCEECHLLAVVADGRCFVPVTAPGAR